MAALTANRAATTVRDGERLIRNVKGGVHIFAGALVCLDALGRAVPGAASPALTADGRANTEQDNTQGVDGALQVEVRSGIFHWNNSAGADLIAQANIGATAYVVDDQTVALTNGGATRSVAGKIIDVDAQGVWVATGIAFPA